MKHTSHSDMEQLGFDQLLADTDKVNEEAAYLREFGHLPATMEEAVPYLCDLIAQHHIAMLDANVERVLQLRKEAHDLARRLSNGEPGILAGPEAPGCRLAELTKAKEGDVPAWGQAGNFTVTVGDMRVRIEMDGVFGIGATFSPWPGFSAHVVDQDKPFISGTGYRSFLGIHAALSAGLTPDSFARQVIDAHVRKELKGKLVMVEERYRT